jgi:hypothetical protein
MSGGHRIQSRRRKSDLRVQPWLIALTLAARIQPAKDASNTRSNAPAATTLPTRAPRRVGTAAGGCCAQVMITSRRMGSPLRQAREQAVPQAAPGV